MIGLSERWREEGLGALRAEIAKAAPAPILFVRRGKRPGALGTASDLKRLLVDRAAHSAGLKSRRRRIASPRASRQPRDSTHRRGRRRLRLADRLRDRGLPGLPPRGDHDLRASPTTRSGPTSSSRTTSARPCCARSPSRTSCRPTGRRSPSSTPGRAAASRRCLRSTRRKYNPGVPEILTEARRRQHAGWAGTTRACPRGSAGCSARSERRPPHFVLYDEDANFIGRAKHVMLALRPRAALVPAACSAKARKDPAIADRIVQAYEPKELRPGRAATSCSAPGIASVNEWANALDAGAKCISLRRNPAPDEQDLNMPRCLFESLGIDAFQALPFDAARRVPRHGPQGHHAQAPRAGSRGSRRGRRRAASRSCSARSTRSSAGPPGCASTSRASTARTPAGST